MNPSYYRISLDVHEATSQLSFSIKKGDNNRRLLISLMDNGVPYEITEDCYAIFSARKPDGTIVFNDCTIEDNMIEYDFTTQTTSVEGRLDCEIALFGSKGVQLTSPRFTVIVYAAVFSEEEVESSSEYKSLAVLVSEGTELVSKGTPLVEELTEIRENYADTVEGVGQGLTNLENKVDALHSNLHIIVTELPTANDETIGKFYLVPCPSGDENDRYDEYITVLTDGVYSWEKTGSKTLAVDGYVQDVKVNGETVVGGGIADITLTNVTVDGEVVDTFDADTKVDKVSRKGSSTNGTYLELTDGRTVSVDVSQSPHGNAVARFTNRGTLQSNTPTEDKDVTNKKHVEDYAVPKVTVENNAGNKVYIARADGGQDTLWISQNPAANYAVRYSSDATLKTSAPVGNNDCINKEYFDNNALQKISTTAGLVRLYCIMPNGSQNTYTISDGINSSKAYNLPTYFPEVAETGAIPTGYLYTGTPKIQAHAANKKYVDGYKHSIKAVYTSGSRTTTIEFEINDRKAEAYSSLVDIKLLLPQPVLIEIKDTSKSDSAHGNTVFTGSGFIIEKSDTFISVNRFVSYFSIDDSEDNKTYRCKTTEFTVTDTVTDM